MKENCNVVKDIDVQKMLTNSLAEDSSQLEPATFEPKMTRAQMKQVLAKEGNGPYPWPFSPINSSSKVKKNFTDLVFSEDEDDEDFVPDKDLATDLSGIYSDEDNDSTHTSDVGSPACVSSPACTNSPAVNQLASLVIPARQDNLSDAVAKRTRSQVPLHHKTISNLEAEFVPPDITLDMYEDPEQEEDPDWQDFLKGLVMDDIPMEDDDDPEADPEYNVLAEPEAEDDHILPIKETEIKLLMDEWYENDSQDNDSQDNDDDSQDMPIPSINKPKPLPIKYI